MQRLASLLLRRALSTAPQRSGGGRRGRHGSNSNGGGGGGPRIGELPSIADVLSAHKEHWRRYRPIDLSASWNAIVKLVDRQPAQQQWLRHDPAALEPLASHTAATLQSFPARPVAIAAHSLARLQGRSAWRADEALWHALAARGEECVDDFTTQGLASTASAFAASRRAAPELLDAIAASAARRAGSFSPRTLASTAEAYAKADHAAPALFGAIAAEAAGQAADFSPRDASATAWAFAKAGHAAPALFDALATAAVAQTGQPEPPRWHAQDLSDMAWAYARAGHAAPALLDAIGGAAAARAAEFTPRGLAMTAWAYARCGVAAPALFEAIATEATRRIDRFGADDVAETARAFAVADVRHEELLGACVRRAASLGREMEATTAATASATASASASAVEGAEAEAEGAEGAATGGGGGGFSRDGLARLHQAQLWVEHEWRRPELLAPLPAALRARCRDAHAAAASGRPVTGGCRRQRRDVGRALASLRVGYEPSVLLDEGVSVDFALPQRRVAIELAPPAHFLRSGAAGPGGEDATHTPTGGALLKRRLLRSLGWTVVPVPHYAWQTQWHDGRGDSDEAAEARQRLMAKLLLDAIDRRAAGAAGKQEEEPPG